LSGSVLAQEDIAAGKLKADTCLGCHGIPGYTNVYPSYHVPKLGGQHSDYIVSALQAYKAGQRDHDTMHAQAVTLSAKDMANIGAYFESLGSAASAGSKPQQTASSGGQQTSSKSAAGEQTYAQVCASCHDSGASGAPKLGDKTAWQPRIQQGQQTLYSHAINGFGAMPPKGGDPSLSDADVQAAVDYMVSEAGGAQQTASAGGKAAQESQPPAMGPGIKQAAAGGAALENESVYQGMCASCHDSGALGAPKITDSGAWETRIAMGSQALYTSAIGGVGAMPAKGGHPQLSDAEVKLAVDYIISQVAGGGQQQSEKAAAAKQQSGAAKTGQSIEQIAARGASADNESVYQGMCASCHDSGALGAPKITDRGAWQSRIAMGAQALYTSAIGGVGAMPAKGGHPQLSDAEVKLAVDYIISQVVGGGQQKAAAAKQPQSGAAKKGQSINQIAARGASTDNESVYQGMCASCHDSGALGAPKITDRGAWQSRIAMGAQALYTSAIGGVGAMPAKGGHPQLSDADVKLAVDYIISQVAGGGQQQSGKAAAAEQPQSGTTKKGQ